MRKRFLLIVVISLFLNACGVVKILKYYSAPDPKKGALSGGVFVSEDTSYEIGELPPPWKRITVDGGDLAFYNETADSTIAVNSNCGDSAQYSLTALSDALFIGIKDKKLIASGNVVVDGEQALLRAYGGIMEGVEFNISAVVLKKDICVYDFTYAASPANFDAGVEVFDAFIQQFRVMERK